MLSRMWGFINTFPLPVWTRERVLGWYASAFHANLDEMEKSRLMDYRNLGDFFTRKLKPSARTIDHKSDLISPVDGRILAFGEMTADGFVEQIKGVSYKASTLIGKEEELQVQNAKNKLFHVVIYLSPGDYHRFHSPTKFSIKSARHFEGELMSVSPFMARWLPSLFSLNERIALLGTWKHGFFSMIPVGATNVGSIHLGILDEDVKTNSMLSITPRHFSELPIRSKEAMMTKGEELGMFKLGSTVILLFEAPPSWKWHLQLGQKIQLGQSMGQHK